MSGQPVAALPPERANPRTGRRGQWRQVTGCWHRNFSSRATRSSSRCSAASTTPMLSEPSRGDGLSTPEPTSRRLLLEYLDRPLNAFRHEPLVKRLFKQAEAAGDDAVMARFLVALDRSVERVRKRIHHYERQTVATADEARKLQQTWQARGFDSVSSWQQGRQAYLVWGTWSAEGLVDPRDTTMPREKPIPTLGPDPAIRTLGQNDRSRMGGQPSPGEYRQVSTGDRGRPVFEPPLPLSTFLRRDPKLPPPSRLALLPPPRTAASRAIRSGDRRGSGPLRGRRRQRRHCPARPLGFDSRALSSQPCLASKVERLGTGPRSHPGRAGPRADVREALGGLAGRRARPPPARPAAALSAIGPSGGFRASRPRSVLSWTWNACSTGSGMTIPTSSPLRLTGSGVSKDSTASSPLAGWPCSTRRTRRPSTRSRP